MEEHKYIWKALTERNLKTVTENRRETIMKLQDNSKNIQLTEVALKKNQNQWRRNTFQRNKAKGVPRLKVLGFKTESQPRYKTVKGKKPTVRHIIWNFRTQG